MKVSETWLREWVDPSVTGETLAAQLTMAGLEVDARSPVAPIFTNVITAFVVDTQPHPKADRLTLCTVDDGSADHVQIVCGAPNVRAGLKVVLAQVGASLPGGVVIKSARLRGESSAGMLCSFSELGLEGQAEGIIELPNDAPIGESIRKYLNLDDHVLDLDLTPNRADCFSILGVAREVAVLNQMQVKPMEVPTVPKDTEHTLDIAIHADEACPQYYGCIINDINADATSPLWLVERLRRAGLRAVHPVVDVANYVMLETGQPMHAFDLDKIDGGIHVRFAYEGEALRLLNDQLAKLDKQTLMIADKTKPLAIAGVMGGIESAVQHGTTSIFLESAFFAPQCIAGVARRYSVASDAAQRFERGVDPTLPTKALARAISLLQTIVGGQVGPVVSAESPTHIPQQATLVFRPQQVTRLTGIKLTEIDIERLLEGLGMMVTHHEDAWEVVVPSHRFDISIEADLVEEVARLWGYDNIETEPTEMVLQVGESNETEQVLSAVTDCLKQRSYLETISYSFVDDDVQRMMYPAVPAMALLNPISPDLSVMRVSLWPGLVASMIYNVHRQQPHLKLFESGVVFEPEGDTYQERQHVAGLITGSVGATNWNETTRHFDFYDAKGDVESLLETLYCNKNIRFEPAQHEALHPGQSARIMKDELALGWVGMLHPRILDALSLSSDVALFELALNPLQHASAVHYHTVSKYPSVRRDLSLLIDEHVTAYEVERVTREVIPPAYLKSFDVFDFYVGNNIPSGMKSLAIGLTLQEANRTLVDDDVNKLMDALVNRFKEVLGANLRD